MKHITQILLILITLSLITSCEKSDPLAACKADPTCEFFSCKVDGKEWTPYCESAFLGCDAVDVQYYEDTGYLLIPAKKMEISSIVFELKPVLSIGSFNLNNNFQDVKFIDKNLDTCRIFYLDTTYTSYFKINKIDTESLVIEAEFSFNTINDCGSIINISDGELRQKYRF